MPQESTATRVVHAVCSHDCPDSCGVLVTVDEASGRAIKMQGDPAHPVTRGFLCGKVAKYLDRVYSPDRLLYPMRRRPGAPKGPAGYGHAKGREADAFERITWDEALDEIAARLEADRGRARPREHPALQLRRNHRPARLRLDGPPLLLPARSLAARPHHLLDGRRRGAEQRLRRQARHRPARLRPRRSSSSPGARTSTATTSICGPSSKRPAAHGARLIVIDPYRTRTAALADEHLAINPGTDAALALGMMHVILSMGLEDAEYIAQLHPRLRRAARRRAQAGALARSSRSGHRNPRRDDRPPRPGLRDHKARGHPPQLRHPAQRKRRRRRARRRHAAAAHRRVEAPRRRPAALHLGRIPLQLQSAADAGADARRARSAAPARVVNMVRLGEALTSPDAGVGGPPVKALFVYNSNPAAVAPNQNDVLRGMRRDDLFTVVHEQFFTDTADYADILLPAATFLETKDVQGAYGHLFAQLSQQAIAPLGEARSNVALFGDLAPAHGLHRSLLQRHRRRPHRPGARPPATRGSPGSPASGWSAKATSRWRCPPTPAAPCCPSPRPAWFRTPSGRGELTPVPVFHAPAESRGGSAARSGEYPLEFLPRKADNYMNSTFANLAGAPEDAGAHGGHSGDAPDRRHAHAASPPAMQSRSSTDAAGSRSTPSSTSRSRAGVVSARLDWNKLSAGAANVNALTSERLTDIGGGPTFYSTLVEVRKVS